jgi:hypothetical protein
MNFLITDMVDIEQNEEPANIDYYYPCTYCLSFTYLKEKWIFMTSLCNYFLIDYIICN